MTPEELSKRIASTYTWLRMGMGIIALIFPPLLYLGGMFLHHLALQDSMSAYYHAGGGAMRDWFVGILFAIGVMLVLYQGFTPIEDWVLNAAGVLAIGVAMLPMPWPGPPPVNAYKLPILGVQAHGTCAIVFFLCIGYVCVFRADDTIPLLETADQQKFFRAIYKVLGALMVLSPLAAVVYCSFIGFTRLTFFIEAFGVWVFASYWLVKSREISLTRAEEDAALGKLKVVRSGRSRQVVRRDE